MSNFDFDNIPVVQETNYWKPANIGDVLQGTIVKFANVKSKEMTTGREKVDLVVYVMTDNGTFMCSYKPVLSALESSRVGQLVKITYKGKRKPVNGGLPYNIAEVAAHPSYVNQEWIAANKDYLSTFDARHSSAAKIVEHEDDGLESLIDESLGYTPSVAVPNFSPTNSTPVTPPAVTFAQKRDKAIELAIVKLGATDEQDAVTKISMATGLALVEPSIDKIISNLASRR